MKRSLLTSYVAGIIDTNNGESYWTLARYFFPEFITSFILFAVPFLLDANFISHLKSTPAYATQGLTNNLLHLIFKIAEGISIGTVIVGGHLNGQGRLGEIGKVVRDAFWTTVILGGFIAVMLYFGAPYIYYWLGAAPEVLVLATPFLQLRALGIFFTFVYLAFIGFLRSIKNTRTPMEIYLIGAIAFIFFDYALIFGKFGLPALGLKGSAVSSVIQSVVMLITCMVFIFSDERYRPYGISLFKPNGDSSYIKQLLYTSWPVVADKSILAIAYIWLSKMMCPKGLCVTATFCAVKDIERLAFLPAIAFAQVVTIIVSNEFGKRDWQGIKSTIKKCVFLASVMVFAILLFFVIFSDRTIQMFDKTGDFKPLAKQVFPILSVLVFFDLLQLILSGALRGANNVKTVMYVRLAVCFGYFVPVSYVLAQLDIADPALQFLMIYGSFYVGNALMSVVYIMRFRSERWKSEQAT